MNIANMLMNYLRVGHEPVDGGKVFSLSQFLIKTPEHLLHHMTLKMKLEKIYS